MSTATTTRRPTRASIPPLDIDALRAQLEGHPDVRAAREREQQARADVAAARETVGALEVELALPFDERTRGTLRIRADREDAALQLQTAVRGAQVATEDRKATERRIRHEVVSPVLNSAMAVAVRDHYAAIQFAETTNARIQQVEAVERELMGTGNVTVSWPELSRNTSGTARLETWPALVAQERGIDLEG